MSRELRPSPAAVNEFHNRCCRALRIFHSEQLVRPELDHFGPFGMGKNIELLLLNCIEDHVSDLERRHASLQGGLECGPTGFDFRGHLDRFVAQFHQPVALGDLTPQRSAVSVNIEALRPMLRSLIVDRFKLATHTEERLIKRITRAVRVTAS